MCGERCGTDYGKLLPSEVKALKREEEFYCDDHGDFTLVVDWGMMLNSYIGGAQE